MPLPRDAYATTTSLYLPEAYCLDEKALFRDIDAAMNNLCGDTLRMALRHLYIKWGDYCDEGQQEFVSDMMALADARRLSPVRKPPRRRSPSLAGSGEAGIQAALF
ncbi:MAG: hypothetical protein WC073_01660 [Sterolibacterium sp.]